MKRLVFKKDFGMRVFLSDANGFYKSFINVPVKKKDSFLIENDITRLKFQSANGNIIENEFWKLINPINGREYIGVLPDTICYITPIIDKVNNKVQSITAFDGIDLSNTENLDSGFDGFFN